MNKEILQIMTEKCNFNNTTQEELEDLSNIDEIFEVDEDLFHELMGENIEINHDNIIKFYSENPECLEIVVDEYLSDLDLKTWNVNHWRNS